MGQSIDKQAFHQFSYGLFLLTSRVGDRDNGCIINTAVQAASEPRMVSICCIKGSCTQEMIDASGLFNVSVLDESTPNDFFAHFGMQSGHDVEKFDESASAVILGDTVRRSENGLVYVSSANAFFSCTVASREDLGSHIMYAGEVVEAARLSDEPSITYDYYRNYTKKGRVPERAPQAAAETAEAAAANEAPIVAWQCTICGYVYEGAELPDDFVCPLCKHGAEDFEPVRASDGSNAAALPATAQVDSKVERVGTQKDAGVEEGGNTMDKWVCTVCGYIYEGEQPPEECPVCHAPASAFKKVEGELKLAAEHEYGIYAKTVKDNPDIDDETKAYIFEQLKANFQGECSEVGMYLCMARIAHREGYPEIGLYWEKAAFEEAEHAAKFAELLGEDLEPNMKADTKANLAWRVDCEFGATQGKFDLAACAKKNNLDAIHDTVHEMARDEARHGKALKGLLERYF